MSARPRFAAVDDDTADLLALVSDTRDPLPVRRDDTTVFLDACETDAHRHGGVVSVNRVRALVAATGHEIPPRRYSALWSQFTGGPARAMRTATAHDVPSPWETCSGSTSGNDGRPYRLRIWTGFRAPDDDPRR